MSKIMELADAYGNHRMVDGSHDISYDHPDTLKARAALAAEVEKLEKDAEMLRAALEYVCNTCDWHGDDGKDAMRKAIAVLEATK